MPNTELQHYGVKGMKWGVRRNRNSVNKGYSAKQRKERNEKIRKKVKKGTQKVSKAMATVGTYYLYDQIFWNGAGTRAVKSALKAVGMLIITAYTKARGGYDIHWYDKSGRKIV